MKNKNGLLDFLKTKRTKEELILCLEILQEFKRCESMAEWADAPFISWMRLEQFEDFLKLLTDTDVDSITDNTAKDFFKKHVK